MSFLWNSTNTSSGSGSGSNVGTVMYDKTHNDIDTSEVNISCTQGKIHVELRERIWNSWRVALNRDIEAGQEIIESIDVASSWCDGDHRLLIISKANSSFCTVTFNSFDN